MRTQPTARTDPEDRAWRESVFADVVADPTVRSQVTREIQAIHEEGDPIVTLADLMAARHYLKRCIENMSSVELASKSDGDLAALWARGSLGAARHRQRGRHAPRIRSRPRDDD